MCRGKDRMPSIRQDDAVCEEEEEEDFLRTLFIPQDSDLLIAYATTEGQITLPIHAYTGLTITGVLKDELLLTLKGLYHRGVCAVC